MKTHIKIHAAAAAAAAEKNFHCTECEKSFAYSSKLRDHMKMHTDVKPFQCSECGKCFTRPGTLKTHMKIHGGKPYQCEESLKSRMKTYDERNFQCLECNQYFTLSKSNLLKVHMKLHDIFRVFPITIKQ